MHFRKLTLGVVVTLQTANSRGLGIEARRQAANDSNILTFTED